jgi:hypothetical protein
MGEYFHHFTNKRSGLGLGFAKTRDAIAILALTAFLEEFSAFKTLENVAFATQGGGRAEAAML